jgi:CheY-like chemotaxis protein
MRILLLEDNAVIRTMVLNVLTKPGWEVLSFPEPAACPLYHDASCKCQDPEQCADVIVTDFDMPRMNGCAFVQQLVDKGCRVKNIAMLSDSQDAAILEHARKLGFAVFSKEQGFNPLLTWLEELDGRVHSCGNPKRSTPEWAARGSASSC